MNFFPQAQQGALMQRMMGGANGAGPMGQGMGGVQAGIPMQPMFEPGPASQQGPGGVYMPGGAGPIPSPSPDSLPNTGPIPQGRQSGPHDFAPPIYQPPGSIGDQFEPAPRVGVSRFQDAGTPDPSASGMRGFGPDVGQDDARKKLIDAIMSAAYG